MDKNEAIKIIRSNFPTGRHQLCEALETLIPELKESEDERIRKSLLNEFIHLQSKGYKFAGLEGEEIVTWLEKQGEQKFPSLSEKEIVCLKRILDFLREEHNSYTGKDFTNEIAVLEWLITHPVLVHSSELQQNQGEQKSAWSEEDEHILEAIIKEIEANKTAGPEYDEKVYDMFLSWLKSLKVRIQHQHKQEWSEEDWKYYHKLEMFLEVNEHYSKTEKSSGYQKDVHETLSWLKSLKERYTWKPNRGQIEAIEDAIKFLGCTKKVREDLKSLYEQLKKLRKE